MNTVEQLTVERDAARAELSALRRHLAEAQCTASSERARRIERSNVAEHWQREHVKVTDEAAALRRLLAECQADAPKHLRAENQRLRNAAQLFEEQLSSTEGERDALRRQLAECQERRDE